MRGGERTGLWVLLAAYRMALDGGWAFLGVLRAAYPANELTIMVKVGSDTHFCVFENPIFQVSRPPPPVGEGEFQGVLFKTNPF